MKLDLSIIIVSFNTKSILIDCIKSIIDTVKKSTYEIITIDNNSTDGTQEAIRDLKIKNLDLIENKENFGFAKANNIGVKRSKGRYVLFLNSDTVVFGNAIDGIVRFMEDEISAGCATCYIELPNGKIDDASHRGFPTPWRALSHFSGLSKVFPKNKLFAGYSLGWSDLKSIHEIDSCAGAFMIVRRKAGEEIGWWDEDYFWYGEDLDFCFRLKEKNWKIFFVPNFAILHYKGVSGGIKKDSKEISAADKKTKEKAMRARFDAMRIFYNKHYKDRYPSVLNKMVLSGIKLKEKMSKI